MADLLQCPLCRQVPAFHLARRTTEKRGIRCAYLLGCTHANHLMAMQLIEAPAADAAIARWNAEAERQFTAFTARWTDAQRITFRASLGYPAPAPSVPPVPPVAQP